MKRFRPWTENDQNAAKAGAVAVLSANTAGLLASIAIVIQLFGKVSPNVLPLAVGAVLFAGYAYAIGALAGLRAVLGAHLRKQFMFSEAYRTSTWIVTVTSLIAAATIFAFSVFVSLVPSLLDADKNPAAVGKVHVPETGPVKTPVKEQF